MNARDIRKNYRALLKENEWLAFSHRIIQERGKCWNCGEDDKRLLECHHCGYRDIMPWEYDPSEIRVLCRPCHEAIHKFADDLWNEVLGLPSEWHIYEMVKQAKTKKELMKYNDDQGPL